MNPSSCLQPAHRSKLTWPGERNPVLGSPEFIPGRMDLSGCDATCIAWTRTTQQIKSDWLLCIALLAFITTLTLGDEDMQDGRIVFTYGRSHLCLLLWQWQRGLWPKQWPWLCLDPWKSGRKSYIGNCSTLWHFSFVYGKYCPTMT